MNPENQQTKLKDIVQQLQYRLDQNLALKSKLLVQKERLRYHHPMTGKKYWIPKYPKFSNDYYFLWYFVVYVIDSSPDPNILGKIGTLEQTIEQTIELLTELMDDLAVQYMNIVTGTEIHKIKQFGHSWLSDIAEEVLLIREIIE